jgi:hypothetical protein
MRDSYHDDHLLDRVMRAKFPQVLMAVRAMAPDAVRQYVAEMHPAILREYRLAQMRALTADPPGGGKGRLYIDGTAVPD